MGTILGSHKEKWKRQESASKRNDGNKKALEKNKAKDKTKEV